ncbi:hypothetical protein GCM10009712_08320 [Pseudarthrobacter sulfonivorans]
MVVQVFTDEELEGLRRFPEIGRECAGLPPTQCPCLSVSVDSCLCPNTGPGGSG